MTDFHTELINANTWVHSPLSDQSIGHIAHCTAWLKSELCPSFLVIHMRSWCVAVLPRHWSLHSLHPLPLAPLIALSTSLRAVASLCTLPKGVWTLLTRPTPSQVMSPTPTDFKETFVESYTELLTSPPFSNKGSPEDVEYDDTALEDMLREGLTEYRSITLNEKTCLSVSRRLCPKERCDPLESERGDVLSQAVMMHRLELCWTDKKSEFLPSARQKWTVTKFNLIMTEECTKIWWNYWISAGRTSSCSSWRTSTSRSTASSWTVIAAKFGIFVKLMRKVSMRWKNWSDFKGPLSIQFQGENCLKTQTR